ncbi:MAG: YtxH domain-containing protein [Burkholderiales bacterium]
MRKYTSHMVTLAVGIGIGAVAGILFAPAGGSQVRRSLSYRLKRFGERVQGLVTDLTWFKNKDMVTSLAKVAGQDLVERTMLKANKLLEEVKTLSAQLENSQELE